jgi:uncharacterized protein (DUF1330 family)
MPKGYWIARNDVHNPEVYKQYVAANGVAFAKYGGRFLVRGGQYELKEGVTRPRHIVIEFPDYATALACYESPEYRAAAQIRGTASEGDLVIIEGHE